VERALTDGGAGKIRSLQTSELIYAPTDGPLEVDEETKERLGALVEAVEEDQDVLRVWTTIDG
jgi:transcriptional/translational regulatory protein YebC/TACO1